MLQRGGLIAHHTGTLPGIAALPTHRAAVRRLSRFKQRPGPFLLLADSQHTAASLSTRLSQGLRQAMRQCWPGPVSFILPSARTSRRRLAPACYAGRNIAVRVDADAACRHLARLCGGLLISSSLNRRSEPVQQPSRRLRMRWHRHLAGCISDASRKGEGRASSLLQWRGGRLHALRGSLPEKP